MHPQALLQLLLLILLANGMPIFAKWLFGARFAWPIDGGRRFVDGQPVFGHAKTFRGLLVAVVAPALAAPLIHLDWTLGALVGAAAMAGDLLSSFVKRRLALPPHSQALGLDQIPEALFPLLACRAAFSLSLLDIAVGIVAFFIGELLLSRFLYRIGIRSRPY